MMGLSVAPADPNPVTSIAILVSAGVVLNSIEQVADGVIECDLSTPLPEAEGVLVTSIAPPTDPALLTSVITYRRLSDVRYRFTVLVAGDNLAGLRVMPFDVVWFRVTGAASGARPAS